MPPPVEFTFAVSIFVESGAVGAPVGANVIAVTLQNRVRNVPWKGNLGDLVARLIEEPTTGSENATNGRPGRRSQHDTVHRAVLTGKVVSDDRLSNLPLHFLEKIIKT